MQESFEKLKGVDIFALKSYLEKTSKIETSIVVALNEILVNLLFFLLNVVVGFFSLMIRILENIDLYDTYKTYVYNAAKSMWHGFTGSTSGGLSSSSLVGLLLTIGAFYLFYQFFFSRGNFTRKVLHICLVIILGFGYFGSVASTSGGLYILNTVDNLADTVTTKISSISISYGEDQSVKVGDSLADSYIAQTSYTAYVFVNTGQENGKYVNNQTGEEETFDDSKVLGTSDGEGNFTAVSNSDKKDYLDDMGDKADDGKEKNRWVSAVYDYLFIKFFYVLSKIVEAVVLAIPIILVQILNLVAQLLVLIMILLFPVALLVSFVPSMQDILFGVFKVMFGGLAFPAITSLITLIIFYLEKVIENLITTGFDKVISSFPSLSTFAVLFKLIVAVAAKSAVYYFLWKYKGELIEFIMGSRARMKVEEVGHQVESKVSQGKELLQQAPTRIFESAQHLGNFALASTGLVSGGLVNSAAHVKQAGSLFTRNQQPVPTEETTSPSLAPEPATRMEEAIQPVEQVSEPSVPYEAPQHTEEAPEASQGNRRPESPATSEMPQEAPQVSPETEVEALKEQWVSPRKQRKMDRLEQELRQYDNPESMYQAQGSNAFTKNFRKTMTRDDKIKANIERRNRLTQEPERLRGDTSANH